MKNTLNIVGNYITTFYHPQPILGAPSWELGVLGGGKLTEYSPKNQKTSHAKPLYFSLYQPLTPQPILGAPQLGTGGFGGGVETGSIHQISWEKKM